ncbi:hypothetical protein [Tardiphaga robiniae]|uniref:hypothetical protein n=1 Tax=Tardiphaga robiniae TaxID=943830 RepID=UPI001586130F|nr:hypothetical protein [Tardiphaga robiniae]NUU41366.1 hypothetical protein [Tardiphaga robiniae]
MTIFSGCASSGVTPASTSVQISRSCEQLAQTVDHPEPTIETDPRVTVGEYAVALDTANTNLDATRTCQVRQRERMKAGRL